MMRSSSIVVGVVALALMASAGCDMFKDGGGGPTSPSSPGIPGPDPGTGGDNNGPNCGPFGEKVYLRNVSGEETKFWVVLRDVRPACGSDITVEGNFNTDTRIWLELEAGWDSVELVRKDGPNAAAIFRASLGFQTLHGVAVKVSSGTSVTYQGPRVPITDGSAQAIVVTAETTSRNIAGWEERGGITSFSVNYR